MKPGLSSPFGFDGGCGLLFGLELGRLFGDTLAEARVFVDIKFGFDNIELVLSCSKTAVYALKLVFFDLIEAQLVKIVKEPGSAAKVLVDAKLIPAGERASKIDVPTRCVLAIAC